MGLVNAAPALKPGLRTEQTDFFCLTAHDHSSSATNGDGSCVAYNVLLNESL